jgi:histidine kinase/DNA gyrase B/HSP90-like ATPase
VFTRAQLLDAARGTEAEAYERAIDSHVKNIRRKLERDSHAPRYLESVYGIAMGLARLAAVRRPPPGAAPLRTPHGLRLRRPHRPRRHRRQHPRLAALARASAGAGDLGSSDGADRGARRRLPVRHPPRRRSVRRAGPAAAATDGRRRPRAADAAGGSAELPAIEADPLRIRQVLLNLLVNALRYTPAEGVVAIAAQVRPQRIEIRVHDTGSGVAPEDLPRIFERFQKGSDSRGSGLGLPIARKLVLAHGGDIGIASTPGQGTEITVSLPR